MNLRHLTICAASLALATAASAQTRLYVTGSTAYRTATHNGIVGMMDASPAPITSYNGSTYTSATVATITGKIGGADVIVKTSWSGSVGGVLTVAGSLPVRFLPDGTPAGGGQINVAASGNTDPADTTIPDVAMSDTYQSSTPFVSGSYVTLTDTLVGVVPFKWVANDGAPAGLNNMTPQLAQSLYNVGAMSLALFTGNNADQDKLVYAAGRDPDSGTRLTAYAESGIGVAATVLQFKPVAGTNSVASGLHPNVDEVDRYDIYPTQTINGITYPEGQGGEASGSTLANLMRLAATADTGYAVTYSSTGDANTAIAGGAKELTWNGVTYSTTALYEGQYTFWGYEHLMYRPSIPAAKKSVADALANRIKTTDATIKLSDMKVTRAGDGGLVTQDY